MQFVFSYQRNTLSTTVYWHSMDQQQWRRSFLAVPPEWRSLNVLAKTNSTTLKRNLWYF